MKRKLTRWMALLLALVLAFLLLPGAALAAEAELSAQPDTQTQTEDTPAPTEEPEPTEEPAPSEEAPPTASSAPTEEPAPETSPAPTEELAPTASPAPAESPTETDDPKAEATAPIELPAEPGSTPNADETAGDDYTPSTDIHTFTVDENGELTGATNQDGSKISGEVVIPKEVNGIPVTAIDRYAFINKPDITKVTIPNTVTLVEGGSPSGMESAYSYGFRGCTSLEEVVFEDGPGEKLELGRRIFKGVATLKKVTLPTQRECQIDGYAFEGCTGLTGAADINLADSRVVAIKSSAFYGCAGLREVTLPATLVEVGGSDTSSMGSIFYNCTELETITFLDSEDAPADTLLLGYGCFSISRDAKLNTVVLPTDRPISIDSYAFQYCAQLSSVNSAECDFVKIGKYAFNNTGLTEFTVKNRDVILAELNAFEGATPITLYGPAGSPLMGCTASANVSFQILGLDEDQNLLTRDGFVVDKSTGVIVQYTGDETELTIPEELGGTAIRGVGAYAFTGQPVTAITVQAPLAEVSDYAFYGLKELTSIKLPNTVTRVGKYAFANCASLLEFFIGEGSKLTEYDDRAFYGCTSLIGLDMPDTMERIGSYVFYHTAISALDLPAGIRELGSYAFSNMSALETVDLSKPRGAEVTFGTNLFCYDEALNTVKLPEGLTEIGEGWFYNCGALRELDIPDTVRTIGGKAFHSAGVEKLVIPEGVEELDLTLVSSLREVTLPSTLKTLCLYQCRSLEHVELPASVDTLASNCFYYCYKLREIVIPERISELNCGFNGCTALEALVIPAATKIGDKVNFTGCDPDQLVVYTGKGSEADTVLAEYGLHLRSYPENSVTVEVQGAEDCAEIKTVSASKTAAEGAGLTDQVKPYQVSALDALVAAHAAYGKDAKTDLAVDASGNVTRLFGVDSKVSGFILNNEPMPMSSAASTYLKDGDSIRFFTGVDDNGDETGIAWLEFLDGDTPKLAKGRDYTFQVKTARGPLVGMEVRQVQADGTVADTALGTTDAEGKVVLTFAETGDYTLTGYDKNGSYVFTHTGITVYEPDLSLAALNMFGQPAFDTSTKLGNGHYAGELFSGDGQAGFDPGTKEYTVYTNKDTAEFQLTGARLNTIADAGRKLMTVSVDGRPAERGVNIAAGEDGLYMLPAIPFTGDRLTVTLSLNFEENGQSFTDSYTVNVERYTGAMEASANIVRIQGAERTSLSAPFRPGTTGSMALYIDHGMTRAVLDVTVDRGTELKVNDTVQTGGTERQENGRDVTVYRMVFEDITRTYTLTTGRDGETGSLLISGFTEKSPYDGVYTPDRVVAYHPKDSTYVVDQLTGENTLTTKTAWNKYTCLGGFGGYIDYYYEDPIVDDPRNPFGVDFIVYGNGFSSGGAPECAGVKVSEDGVTWYDLAGQRHYELSTYYDYAILKDGSVTESLMIARQGENGHEGYPKNVNFGYGDVMACSGNANGEGTYWVTAVPANPYDASLKIGDGMDLAWAVDRVGKPVDLTGMEIHYIRLQSVADIPQNGGFGTVSPEIGTVTKIRSSSQNGDVGVTAAPKILVKGEALPAPSYTLKNGAISYYEVDLRNQGFPLVSVQGAKDDTIYVNMEQYTGSALYIGLPDENRERTVRVLVQSGEREPYIAVIHFTNSSDPNSSTELESVVVNDGLALTASTNGQYSGEVMNLTEHAVFQLRSLNPDATIELKVGTGDYMPVTYGEDTEDYPLSVGANLFTIRITAVNGTQKEYPVILTRKAEISDPGTGKRDHTVRFTFTGDTLHYVDKNDPGNHAVQVWIPTTSVTVPAGTTVKELTDTMLRNAGISFSTDQGSYISGVQIPSGFPDAGKWLEEFSNGPNSGWMYKLNGKMPNLGYAEKVLSNGDAVEWFYTDDYTKETDYDNNWGSGIVTSSKPSERPEPAEALSPAVTPDASGEAKVEIGPQAMKEAVADAKQAGVDEIVIEPQVEGSADKITVELDKSSVDAVARQTDADLTVRTGAADVTIPQASLEDLASQSDGKVSVSVEIKDGGTAIQVAVDSKAVETLKGGLKVGLSAAEGEVLVIVGPDGTETVVKKSITEDGRIKALLDGSCTVKVIHNHTDFSDVADSAWYAGAVDFASGHALFNGTGGNAFSPNAPMTRGMMATVLWRLEGEQDAEVTGAFSDVAEGAWYAGGVAWASRHGIVEGYDGRFTPNSDVTREQLATMLWRYAKDLGMDVTASDDLDGFTDGDTVSSYASDAAKWAVGTGLIRGKDGGRLDPTGNATRAEVATVLERVIRMVVA